MYKLIDEQPDGCVSLATLWAFCWLVVIAAIVIALVGLLIQEALR